jgi:tetratricopeptide (TPR) repeat protein
MAKKTVAQSKKPAQADKNGFFDVPERWVPWAFALVAFFIYSTGFKNAMVGLDDHTATVNNPAVRDFLLFNGFNLGMFAPLTWIGYEIAYILGKDNPFWYHLLSGVVHALNVVLVFRLFRRLDFGLTTAALVSLFFAIHPLQVEAVAWIAGFSTPLFSFFSLLATNYYLDHTKEGTGMGKAYWLALGMFVAACLAKSAAVTLPLTLLVLDWWKKRPLDRQSVLEKVPFFAVALGFGALTIYSRQFAGQLNQPADFSLLDRGLMVCHSIVFYWKKLLLPTGLSIWYPFEKNNGVWSWDYYASPAILAAILFGAWRSRLAMPLLWFGALFYLSNIILALPWATFGTFELRSDRYNYLAGLGMFAILASLPGILKEKQPKWENTAWAVLVGYTLVCLVGTLLRVRDWKDTPTLLSKAMAVQGDNFGKAYLWRGMAYGKAADAPKAIKDFTLAIEKNPMLIEAYKYRGNLHGVMKNFQQSVDDLTKFLEQFPNEVPELYNRGLSYANLNRDREAIADFSRAMELDTSFTRVLRARGNCYKKIGEYEKAAADLSRFLEKNPNEVGELYNRGTAYAALGKNREAIEDFSAAIQINPTFAEAYKARADCYRKIGETAKAEADQRELELLKKDGK